MKHKRIDFCMAFLDKREEDAVIKVLRSGWLTTGPCAKRFEKDISNYLSKLIPKGGSLGYLFRHMEHNAFYLWDTYYFIYLKNLSKH